MVNYTNYKNASIHLIIKKAVPGKKRRIKKKKNINNTKGILPEKWKDLNKQNMN